MSAGWIKIHRQLLEHPRYSDPEWLSVWMYLLLKATHQLYPVNFDGRIIELKPGQLVTGRHAIAEVTGVHNSKVKRILAVMRTDQQIDQQAGVKGSVITVLNWTRYQSSEQQNGQPTTSERPASDQPATTNKNERTEAQETQENSSVQRFQKGECEGEDAEDNLSWMDSVDPLSLKVNDLMKRLKQMLGAAEMDKWGGRWRNLAKACPKAVRGALGELKTERDQQKQIKNPGSWAWDIAERFAKAQGWTYSKARKQWIQTAPEPATSKARQ